MNPKEVKPSSSDEWFEEYTDRLMIQHLCLLEDHLLEMVRDPSDQCQSCMAWHIVKIRAYASLECVKFSEGEHKEVCINISPFMDELEAEMEKGLGKEKSLELAKEVREWRYKIAGFQGEDSQIEEVTVSSRLEKPKSPGDIWNASPSYRQAEIAKIAGQTPRLGKVYWLELTQGERVVIEPYLSLEEVAMSSNPGKEEPMVTIPRRVWEDAVLVSLEVEADPRQKESLRQMASTVAKYGYGIESSSNPGNPWTPPPGAFEHPEYYQIDISFYSCCRS